MHRSGTSALTRVLNLLGAEIPGELMPPSPANETGFWETQEIVDTHDAFLEATDTAWKAFTRLPNSAWDQHGGPFVSKLVEILRRGLGGADMFVVKDPRLCRLVPLWLRVLEQLGAEPCFILMVRDPLEVASSMLQHQHLPLRRSLLLWLRYLLDSERDSRGHRRALVSYDGLLEDWRRVVDDLARDLGLVWPRSVEDRAPEIGEFLSPERRHHRFTVTDLEARDDVSPWVRELYEAARAACWRGREIPTATFDRIREQFEVAEAAFEQELMGAHQWQRELGERELRIEALSGEVADLSQQVTSLSGQLAAASAEADGLSEQVEDLTGQLEAANAARAAADAHLLEVLRSRSWRLTAPLRRIRLRLTRRAHRERHSKG